MSVQPLSIYVHVPFCAARCGYCDFNTYTASELGTSVSRATFHTSLIDEVRALAQAHGDRPVTSVFIGGGTPTLLGAGPLVEILAAIDDAFGLTVDAEVTTEANPDAVDIAMLEELRFGGFTRISLGMQSGAASVLAVLDRTHTPGRSAEMAQAARRVGFEHVNLDLIYGTPGETEADLRQSLASVLDAGVDHVSAYGLIVEPGTPLARRIARGDIAHPDDDVAAARYELIDDALSDAGLDWYEVSNWARPGGACRHNRVYWLGADWLGVGPGAHSHVAGRRWWNLKHPRVYADALLSGRAPIDGSEDLGPAEQRMERIMLGVRMREGLPLADVGLSGRSPGVRHLAHTGLVEAHPLAEERLVLTRRGRLLADAVIRTLLD